MRGAVHRTEKVGGQVTGRDSTRVGSVFRGTRGREMPPGGGPLGGDLKGGQDPAEPAWCRIPGGREGKGRGPRAGMNLIA